MSNETSKAESNYQKKIAVWRLMLLSASGGAVDLGYAIEASHALPVIQGVGISLKFATIVLSLSPIFGMFFQPFLGSISDHCRSPCGRRKPFILSFSVMAIIGCMVPFMTYLADVGLDMIFVQVAVVALITLFDFSIGQLQLPTQAFLLDIVPLSQAETANFIHSSIMMIYTTLGFALGAVPWSQVFGNTFTVKQQAQVVFGLGGIIIFISLIATLFSSKEIPYKQQSAGNNVNINSGNNLMNTVPGQKMPPLSYDDDDHGDSLTMPIQPSSAGYMCCKHFNVLQNNVIDTLSFIYYMSSSMWIVWFVVLFAFVGDFAFVTGFTTFMGTVVYGGDPNAHVDSNQYQLFFKGVRMGSLALTLSAVFGGIFSLTLNFISKWIKVKTILLFCLAFSVVALFLMTIFQKFYYIMIAGLFYGPYLTVIVSIPFALIPLYEEKQLLFRRVWHNAPDVIEGKACGVLFAAMFFGQIVASFVVGPTVDAAGDGNYLVVIPCVAITVTFLIAVFIKS